MEGSTAHNMGFDQARNGLSAFQLAVIYFSEPDTLRSRLGHQLQVRRHRVDMEEHRASELVRQKIYLAKADPVKGKVVPDPVDFACRVPFNKQIQEGQQPLTLKGVAISLATCMHACGHSHMPLYMHSH